MFQTQVRDLPNRLWKRNELRQLKGCRNRGQLYLGFATKSGHHTQAVLGRQVPFLQMPSNVLRASFSSLVETVQEIEKLLWEAGKGFFPEESKAMMLISPSLRRSPSVGWTSVALAENVAVRPHRDRNNMRRGWQGVCVIGVFQGGNLLLEDAIVVRTRHGLCFFGKNRQILHGVSEVFAGHRLIIACWSRQDIFDFSTTVLSRMPWETANHLRNNRVACLKELRRRVPARALRKPLLERQVKLWRNADFEKY